MSTEAAQAVARRAEHIAGSEKVRAYLDNGGREGLETRIGALCEDVAREAERTSEEEAPRVLRRLVQRNWGTTVTLSASVARDEAARTQALRRIIARAPKAAQRTTDNVLDGWEHARLTATGPQRNGQNGERHAWRNTWEGEAEREAMAREWAVSNDAREVRIELSIGSFSIEEAVDQGEQPLRWNPVWGAERERHIADLRNGEVALKIPAQLRGTRQWSVAMRYPRWMGAEIEVHAPPAKAAEVGNWAIETADESEAWSEQGDAGNAEIMSIVGEGVRSGAAPETTSGADSVRQ